MVKSRTMNSDHDVHEPQSEVPLVDDSEMENEKPTVSKKKRCKTVATKGKGTKITDKKGKKVKVESGDDEFEDLSKQFKVKSFGSSGVLRNRMSPSSVVSVFKKIIKNQKQLQAVRDIGFGSLEHLQITQLPLHLGLWLVKNFDSKTCSLCIPDYEPIHVTTEHIHEVLGLPIGGEEIDIDFDVIDKDLVKQWKKQENSVSVRIGDLTSYLKQSRDSGAMFKRNFVVLCVSTLMSGSQNMNVNHWILRYLGDVERIKNLNWFKYILDCLVDSKIYWDELPSRYFPGSLLLLMLFYVDRFEIEDVRSAREIPILKGWTTKMLSSREKLEIYQGRVCVSSSVADEKQLKSGVGSSSKTKSSLKPKNKQSVPTESKTNEDSEVDPKKKCLMELATASTNLVLAYMDFGKKHEAAVKLFPNNEKIKKLKEDALLIYDEQKIHSEVRNEGEGLSFSQDEEYWQDPAVIEAWDRFSKVSGTEKPPESAVIHSNVHATGDQLPESAAVNVSQIASEALAMLVILLILNQLVEVQEGRM